MMFTYMMLASVFVNGMVMSCSLATPMEVTFEDIEIQTLDESAIATTEMEQSESLSWTSGGGFERSSNLKYVTAIQKSGIWSDVRRRTMKISSQVNGEMIDKSPETMSDQELAQLKQACHDGLKCVAVDQLLILKSIKQQMEDGSNKMGVRTAITKITKVITEYTTEYHEDTYEYFEVTEADDSSKVYQSVTTIVEDNKELCKINVENPTSSGDSTSNKGTSYSNNSSSDNDGSSSNTIAPPSDQATQIFQNFGTVNNYNINQGTINEATVNMNLSDSKSNRNADSKQETQDQGMNTDNTTDVIIKLGEENEKKPEVNYHNDGLPQENTTESNETQSYSSPQNDGTQADSNSPKTEFSTYETEDNNNNLDVSESGDENAKNNSLDVTNTNEGGCGDTNVDLASSGSSNKNEVLKGYVYSGNLNNGDMKVYNINKGTINKGTITDSNANLISIGTINKGPITYENYNDYSNNKSELTLNNVDVQQYVANLDKAYSSILENLH